MTPRDIVVSIVATDEDNEYHTEEILNVLRESNEEILGSSDIEDAIGITTDQATDRLKDMKDDGRVDGRQVGRPWVWTLHPDERRKVVPPTIDRLVHTFDAVRTGLKIVLTFGWIVTLVGFLLLFWGVTDMLVSSSFQVMAVETALEVGWLIALAGSVFGILAGSGIVALLLIENTAIRQVRKTRPPKQTGTPAPEESRGHVSPQFLLVGVVLLLLAKPLTMAAIKLQQGFAANPAFSAGQAALIAVLIVAAIVAAAFDR